MPTKETPKRRLEQASICLAIVVAMTLAVPAAGARGTDDSAAAPWADRLVARIAALIGLGAADLPTLRKGGPSDRAPGDAVQRHHLTIEPGGDAIPPPPGDDDGTLNGG